MAATVDQKLLKATKFPPEFNKKVDMQKVNIEVMKKYASNSPQGAREQWLTSWLSDGSQVKSQTYSDQMMTSLSNFASICSRAPALYGLHLSQLHCTFTDYKQPDVKVLQIQLTGFLEKDTAAFCKELWTLCLSAQSNPQGVPKELLEAKKLELIQEKVHYLEMPSQPEA